MSSTPSTDSTSSAGRTAAAASDLPLKDFGISQGNWAVVGLQWGDEGKGKVVDLLAPQFDLVVRYNGGANAGHSVQVGETRYALHLIPSGILYADKLNVLGNGVVIDPEQLIKEINGLRERDVKIESNLQISDRAHVVLPYHKEQDRLLEAALSATRGDGKKIGTTGRGIGPCYADKALRATAIRMGELLSRETLCEKLTHVVAIKNMMLKALAEQSGESFDLMDPEAVCEQALAWGDALRPFVVDATSLVHDSMDQGKRLLFEGANATLLDIDHGTYPYVTSSNCSSLGVHTGTSVPGSKVDGVIGIVKAYQTRVGGGPMPTELFDETGDRIRDVGREYGTTTGRPRRCGWLDLVALRYSARISGATVIGLMLLDVLAGLPELKVCVGYKYEGKVLDTLPADCRVLEDVEPVYETLEGFAEPVDDCVSYDDLPAGAKAYIARIEKYVGVPVRIVSVGPRRSQTIIKTD